MRWALVAGLLAVVAGCDGRPMAAIAAELRAEQAEAAARAVSDDAGREGAPPESFAPPASPAVQMATNGRVWIQAGGNRFVVRAGRSLQMALDSLNRGASPMNPPRSAAEAAAQLTARVSALRGANDRRWRAWLQACLPGAVTVTGATEKYRFSVSLVPAVPPATEPTLAVERVDLSPDDTRWDD